MKHYLYILFFLTLFSCNNGSKKLQDGQDRTFETIRYSKQFGILRSAGFKQVFYIHGKDTQWGLKFNDKAPPPKIAVLSTIFAGFIELLNQQDHIVAIDNENFYSDPLILKKVNDKSILAVGEEGQVQIEKLLAQKPDYLISSTFEFNKNTTGQRLEKLGIRILYCDNFKEQHPLARAEWIKFFGVITGQLSKADSLFNIVESRYNAIANKKDNDTLRPKPGILVDAMYGDSWFVPGGNSFTAQLIMDAGGNYLFKDKKPLYTYPLTLEEVFVKAKDADIWIHTNQYYSLNDLKNADMRYTFFKPYIDHKIYNNNKKENEFGGNDFWEKGVGRPDLILSDLFKIFHSDIIQNDSLNYYNILE